jgi:hypothetical protein
MVRQEDLQDAPLVPEIQVGGRLVQEQDGRLLGQGAGDGDELALPPGQLIHAAHGEVQDPGGLHDGPGHGVIPRARPPAACAVRVPAHQHDLGHPEGEGHVEFLRDHGHPLGQGQPGEPGDLPPLDQDPTPLRRQHLAQEAQERALAGAVGPDDPQKLRRPRPERDILHALPGPIPEADPLHLQ